MDKDKFVESLDKIEKVLDKHDIVMYNLKQVGVDLFLEDGLVDLAVDLIDEAMGSGDMVNWWFWDAPKKDKIITVNGKRIDVGEAEAFYDFLIEQGEWNGKQK